MVVKPKLKRTYTKRNPTLIEQVEKLRRDCDELSEESKRNVETMERLFEQRRGLEGIIENYWTQLITIKEINQNLIEAVNILGRKSRLETQEKLFSDNRGINAVNTVTPK